MLRTFAAIFCVIGFSVALATAGPLEDWERMRTITPKGYACGFATEAPVIDGRLDEKIWQAAPWTDEFVDIEADRKPKPRLRTRAKMLWDDEHFYIAAELDEPHVWGTLTEHDAVVFQDNDFEVFIDPNGDNHEYYELELNALNTTWDLFLGKPYKDGGPADNKWEIPGLKTAVHVSGTLNNSRDEDKSWSIEIAIPWKALAAHAHRPTPPRDGDQWRVNFSRVQWQHEIADGKYRKKPDTREDNWVWSPQGIIDMHRPERWGYVQFSKKPPGRVPFVADLNHHARELLMEVYHRQKEFHAREKRWAATLKELEFEPRLRGLVQSLEMQATENGFEATIDATNPLAVSRRWHVRQDSKLWSEPIEQTAVVAAPPTLENALARSGENRSQIQKALDDVPAAQRESMEFLVKHMPTRDLTSLSADFLLENVRLAHEAVDASPWKGVLPKDVFHNNVLPYANINEGRDPWRKDFYERFGSLVKDAKTPGAAAAMLNQKIWKLVNVRYSTGRPKADQSPQESIKAGLASCTGLSVLLIDACRAVGVPARFVGTPLWADKSGNHSWIEVWDGSLDSGGWHFTGAAEPAGDRLNEVWFMGRASAARRDHPLHAIYAVSYERTPLRFPLPWDRDADYVYAVNVSDRYIDRAKPADGTVRQMFRVLDRTGGPRVAAAMKIVDSSGKTVFEGTTKDERFDANDHVHVDLPPGQDYRVEIRSGERTLKQEFKSEPREAPLTWHFTAADAAEAKPVQGPLAELEKYLAQESDKRTPLEKEAFATVPLSRADAAEASKLLWQDHVARIRKSREEEMKAREITLGKHKMPFWYKNFGEKPATGRSMVISMHGGGGAPKRVNDQQYENQKRLYELEEGVYVVPRAPTDTWNLWHQGHIDEFFDRLIENLIVFEEVDPDRVYLMGYSAGGDGVFQVTPRMADRFAAAAMMAGHPNETSPLGLRNVAFTIHMGGLDAAYNRNKVAREWQQKLADLRKDDPDGYEHVVKIHEDKSHWMDRKDAEAIPWMAKHRRNMLPTKIVWKQDDVVRTRFYWLAVDAKDVKGRAEVVARRDGQQIELESKDASRLTVRLCDEMLDLDKPVTIRCGDKTLFEGNVPRTIVVLSQTLAERGDPKAIFCGSATVDLPKAE